MVLCEPYDAAALWAMHGLRNRGIRIDLSITDDLVRSSRVVHRVGSDGSSIEWTLADGRTVGGSNVQGVLNRIVAPPWSFLTRFIDHDRDYANQELFAFFLSSLHALPRPVLNRPTPLGLSGAWRHRSEWAVLAAQAGLCTLPLRVGPGEPDGKWVRPSGSWPGDTPRTVFVVGMEVVGAPADPAVDQGCRRLAELADTDLLGVDLIVDLGTDIWTFVGADPCPDLRLGGDPLLDALARALTQ